MSTLPISTRYEPVRSVISNSIKSTGMLVRAKQIVDVLTSLRLVVRVGLGLRSDDPHACESRALFHLIRREATEGQYVL